MQQQVEMELGAITVHPNGVIWVQEFPAVQVNGQTYKGKSHRHVVEPGDSTVGQALRVQAVMLAVHTADVVRAWENRVGLLDA